MDRSLLTVVRRSARTFKSLATRVSRTVRFGLDHLFWSRLFHKSSSLVPAELTEALLRTKGIQQAPPHLHVSGTPAEASMWGEGFSAVYAYLFLNLQAPDVLSPVRYAHPSPAFPGVYLWDSAFIAQVWKNWDIEVARDVCESVVVLRDGDRLQHVVADLSHSDYTQPPLIAWSVFELHRKEADLEWLASMYEPLVGYNAWLYKHRRLEHGLFYWQHPYESGADNSPRFSSRDESTFRDTTLLAAPDLSSYILLQNEALAGMARALTRDAEADAFEEKAEQLRRLMNERLWNEGDGLYYDWDVKAKAHVRSDTIASLMPLWAGVPDRDKAVRMKNHVMDAAAYNTLLPLPSVARNNPEFSQDMWRGPVWVNTAYGVLSGLQRYGFYEEASELAYRLCDGVYRTYAHTGHMYEFYDPDHLNIDHLHRKKGNVWKQWTLGNKPRPEFVGWSGLVNTLAVDLLIGYDKGRQTLSPRFPERAADRSFSVHLPAERLTIDLSVLAGRKTRGSVRSSGGVRPFQVDFGEVVHLNETDELHKK